MAATMVGGAHPTKRAGMPRIRFNHVFLALMFMTGLSAFVIPQEKTNLLRGRADGLFRRWRFRCGRWRRC